MLAVIETGSHQYLVEKGQTIQVELLADTKTLEFKPLLLIDGEKVTVGKPTIDGALVKADITEAIVKGEKLTILHYKPKKRIKVKTGHRQKYTTLTITDIKA